jgi:hypothetical protein
MRICVKGSSFSLRHDNSRCDHANEPTDLEKDMCEDADRAAHYVWRLLCHFAAAEEFTPPKRL